ncbi:hypothetical protein EB796_018221 [Bugula neritina]|uniref:Uncharacterized protein n=1 Tax=Bugula neritina TaxID=10212 RepID=A0A7J7JBL6_BUGNE|nr:hypothetical protein EB796_018221 [Bugula neritina]
MQKQQAALKSAELKLEIMKMEKVDMEEQLQREGLKFEKERQNEKEETGYIEKTLKEKLEIREAELRVVRKESIESKAVAEEKEGAALHWKLKCEDRNRELHDLQEKLMLELKVKDREIQSLKQVSKPVTTPTKIPDEKEILQLTQQIKEIQHKHMELITKTKSTDEIQGENIDKFYSEIGSLALVLHSAVKEKDAELEKLDSELTAYKVEKEAFQEECAKMIQDKQMEIRKLCNQIEKLEVESAKFNASKEAEISKLKAEVKDKVEKAKTEKAHVNASKENQITKLKSENDKLSSLHQRDTKTIHDLREQIKKLESDRTQLSLQRDSMKATNERLRKDLEQVKQDKKYLEKMVDRLNHEMEVRVAAVRRDSNKVLQQTEENVANIYGKMEKIARERGEISTELQAILKEKETRIEKLSQQVEKFSSAKEKAEGDLKQKMEKKSKEVVSLRSEIKKMGLEGVKLLEQREKEIMEMRTHLKNVLKVMESKARASKDMGIPPAMEAAVSKLNVQKPSKLAPAKSTAGAASQKSSTGMEPKQQKSASDMEPKQPKSALTITSSKKLPAKVIVSTNK